MCKCLSSAPSDPDGGDGGTSCDGGQPCLLMPGDLIVTVIDDEDNSKVEAVPVKIQGPLTVQKPSGKDGVAEFRGITPGGYTITHASTCLLPANGGGTVTASATTPVELRVRHIHASITIQELTYSGHNRVEKDTTGLFPAPEWVAGRARADQSPVSYARKKKVSFTAKFKVTTAPCRPEVVDVKGNATFGPAALEWTGKVTVNPGAADVSVALTSTQDLADEVGLFDGHDITWQMNPATRGWAPAGTSQNSVYVTLADPSVSPNYWTLLEISCRGGTGTKNEDDFVKASFVPYTSHIGNGSGFRRMRDGTELTYYKKGADTPSVGVFQCSDILSRADGTGRCGAWARFLVAMHQIHGVTSSTVFGVVPINAPFLIVKNVAFSGPGSLPVPFTHLGNAECTKITGIPGQGKTNPQFIFKDHALVRHATGIYDPSYGVGPIPDLKHWEDGGIGGIGDGVPVSLVFDGDNHGLPRGCSQGFAIHTAAAGETLGSIATKYGAASGNVLYDHPYNASFKATHPAPVTIMAGDKLHIPRAVAPKVAIMRIA